MKNCDDAEQQPTILGSVLSQHMRYLQNFTQFCIEYGSDTVVFWTNSHNGWIPFSNHQEYLTNADGKNKQKNKQTNKQERNSSNIPIAQNTRNAD